MNILNDEVFAVIMAIIVVGSVFSAAYIYRLQFYVTYSISDEGIKALNIKITEMPTESFTAIGLLNEECKIGEYPSIVFLNENLTLCIYVANYLGYPALLQVRYKIVYNLSDLPTNTSPSRAPVLRYINFILPNKEDYTTKISIPIAANPSYIGRNITLVFELWQFEPHNMSWIYSGRWVHLHVELRSGLII